MFGKTSTPEKKGCSSFEKESTSLLQDIRVDDLEPGATFAVRGYLNFSKLRSPIRDKQLARNNAFRKRFGFAPRNRPYTTATIHDAFVVYSSDEITLEERFAEQRLYKSSKESSTGKCYTAFNMGYILPYIAKRNLTDGDFEEIAPEGELDTGLDVTLQLRVFQSSSGRKGVSLDGVVVEEPIRYYRPSDKYEYRDYYPTIDHGGCEGW